MMLHLTEAMKYCIERFHFPQCYLSFCDMAVFLHFPAGNENLIKKNCCICHSQSPNFSMLYFFWQDWKDIRNSEKYLMLRCKVMKNFVWTGNNTFEEMVQ